MECDVFISCKSEDYNTAREIYDYLKSRGIKTFIACESLRKIGNTAYLDEIDEALDSSENLIVFASKSEYASSKYVKEEWQGFRNELLSGRKQGNLMTIVGGGLTIGELPYGLRRYEVLAFESYKSVIIDYLLKYNGNKEDNIQSREDIEPRTDTRNNIINIFDSNNEQSLLAAVKSGNPEAQYQLAQKYYYENNGFSDNEDDAIQWLNKEAEQGNSDSMNFLGEVYEYKYRHGEDCYELAYNWYEKAAELGNATALAHIGYLRYIEGEVEEAMKWIRKSCEQGCALGQLYRGLMYLLSLNYEEAAKWYRKAAEQNNRNAAYLLGDLYKEGKGVPQNRDEAIKWFRKALFLGHDGALLELEKMGAV